MEWKKIGRKRKGKERKGKKRKKRFLLHISKMTSEAYSDEESRDFGCYVLFLGEWETS